MIRTKEDYIKSLQEQANVVYAGGEKVEDITSHPSFKPHINCAAMIYEMANKPEFEDLATAISHLTGETINRFTHIHQSVEKFLAGVEGVSTESRMRVLRLLENMTGGTALVESMHGAGSPQTQKVMYGRYGNLDMKKLWAKKLAGVE